MKENWFVKRAIVCFFILALASKALLAGPRDHNGGFFLRLSTGVGITQSEYSDPSLPLKFSGLGNDINGAVGAVVFDNFALHATVFGCLLPKPDVELFGQTEQFQGNIILSVLGVGFTYYIMPINICFSPSIGMGRLTIEDEEEAADTDMGPAVDVTLGKEWWVSNEWGLGASGSFGYHHIKEANINEYFSGISFSLRFTATFN